MVRIRFEISSKFQFEPLCTAVHSHYAHKITSAPNQNKPFERISKYRNYDTKVMGKLFIKASKKVTCIPFRISGIRSLILFHKNSAFSVLSTIHRFDLRCFSFKTCSPPPTFKRAVSYPIASVSDIQASHSSLVRRSSMVKAKISIPFAHGKSNFLTRGSEGKPLFEGVLPLFLEVPCPWMEL